MSPVSTIRAHSAPLPPLPTGVEPVLPMLSGIRSVVFDVYGTLIVSGSGDISLAQSQDREGLMVEAFSRAGMELEPGHPRVTDLFYEAVRAAQAVRREDGVEFPEVEIREVWMAVASGLGVTLDGPTCERLAVICECLVNPVWPMPSLAETLDVLTGGGMALGIVSNAQFYTPLLFEAFLGKDLDGLHFEEGLCVWSYREREGKPSVRLYERLAEMAAAKGLEPSEILYVGNDMRNDIWPAREVGFRTALFAGDRRSLRMREDDPRSGRIGPDVVVTDLAQIPRIVGLGSA